MIDTLNGIKIWPGLITSHDTSGFPGTPIKFLHGRKYARLTGDNWNNCPTHNGLIVAHDDPLTGRILYVGESISPISAWTPLSVYEERIRKGEVHNFKIFEVWHISVFRQAMAADWWNDNVHNQPYDWPAFFRLFIKSIFGDLNHAPAGVQWMHYCTEGIKDAFKQGAAYHVYENENATPLMTIELWLQKKLRLLEA